MSSVNNITTYVFSGKPLSLSRKLHSARGAKKKKNTPGLCFFFALRALPPPRSLTHSLACPWLLGGNSHLKQNLSFIKEGFIEENRKHAEQKNRKKKHAEQKNTRSKKTNTRSVLSWT